MTLLDRFRQALTKFKIDNNASSSLAVPNGHYSEVTINKMIEEGNALEENGQYEAALVQYSRVLQLAPDSARAYLNMGNVHLHLSEDNYENAIKDYLRAVDLKPDYVAAHFNLGRVYMLSGELELAQNSLLKAITLDGQFINAYIVLAQVQSDLGKTDASIATYERALVLSPGNKDIYRNLALTYSQYGDYDNAIRQYQHVIDIDPRSAFPYAGIIAEYQKQGKQQEVIATCRRAVEALPESVEEFTQLLFELSHDRTINASELFHNHKAFSAQFEVPLASQRYNHANSQDSNKTLKIGIVSADLRGHAVVSFVESVLQSLAILPSISLQIYHNHHDEDDRSDRLKRFLPRWVNIADLSDDAFAAKVFEDEVDILIDLSGHTQRHRLLSFARRAAPIQVSWLGYPGTTGLQEMDYFLGDPYFLPFSKSDQFFTEKLVRLPIAVTFLPFNGAPDVSPLPATENGFLTFGSFNRSNKINRDVVSLWAKVLREIPDSRMKLGGLPAAGDYQFLIAWFQQEGIDMSRLDFYPRTHMEEYLLLHHEVDVCMDTFPYTGGTTTNHALWMGVPTLTIAGDTPPSRQSAANLMHVGVAEHFVAESENEFVEKANWLNQNRDFLSNLRSGLRYQFSKSAFLNPNQVALSINFALRQMWVRWVQGKPPIAMQIVADGDTFRCETLKDNHLE